MMGISPKLAARIEALGLKGSHHKTDQDND
jgi:hypothetical protein